MTTSIVLQHAPAEVVRQLLIQLGLGSDGISYTTWPVFVDEEPDSPDNCITVEEIQGGIDGKLQVGGIVIEHYGFHLVVRSARTQTGTSPQPGYRVGRNKLDSICQTLDEQVFQTPVTIDLANYLVHACYKLSSINVFGKARTNSGRYSFSVDYQITITQSTGT